MKLFLNIILLITIISTIVLAEDGYWRLTDKINTKQEFGSNYGIRYLAIDCYDSLNCAAAGNLQYRDPLIRVTSNGGNDWSTNEWFTAFYDTTDFKNKYFPPSIADIAYPDSAFCIAVADSGYYYVSRDKCKTWTKGRLIGEDMYGNDKNYPQYTVYMNNKYIGGVVAYRELFLTNDGAIEWKRVVFDLPETTKPTVLEDIYITDSNVIILLGLNKYGNMILRSSDWGENWSVYHPVEKYQLGSIYFINENLGWGCGNRYDSTLKKYADIIQHTSDGGRTWHVQKDSIITQLEGFLFNIEFSDSLNGIVMGGGFKIWRTSDGGNNWAYTPVNTKQVITPLNALHFNNHFNFYAVSAYDGRIYQYKHKYTDIFEDNGSGGVQQRYSIYPNPIKEFLNIHINDETDLPEINIMLYNILGELIISKSYSNEVNNSILHLELSNLAPGVYFIKINDEMHTLIKDI